METEDRWFPARNQDVLKFTMLTVSTSPNDLQVSDGIIGTGVRHGVNKGSYKTT